MSSSKRGICYSDASGPSTSSYSDNWKSAITIVTCDKDTAPFPVQLDTNNSEASTNLLIAQLFLYLKGCGKDPMIKTVAVYKTPLDSWFNIVSVGYHAIVYLTVEDYHLTIEKHDSGLTIQVSKQKDKVLQQFRKDARNGVPDLIVHDDAKMKLKKLVKFIVKKNFVHENYNLWKGIHCKKFAKDIFDRTAAFKKYNWETDETMTRGGVITAALATATGIVIGVPVAIVAFVTGAVATISASFSSREEDPDSISIDSDTSIKISCWTRCWACCFCRNKKK